MRTGNDSKMQSHLDYVMGLGGFSSSTFYSVLKTIHMLVGASSSCTAYSSSSNTVGYNIDGGDRRRGNITKLVAKFIMIFFKI
jgi:choline dehydrogenase-like flavoprotein